MKASRTPLKFDLDASAVSEEELVRAAAVVPKPIVDRKQLGARIPVDLYKRLKLRSVREDTLIQDLIEQAIEQFMDGYEQRAPKVTK